jgi:predicted DNA-binding WGR domain protein
MMITLYRIDNRERLHYYCISNRQHNMFSPYTFTVSSGVALTRGTEKHYVFSTRKELDAALRSRIRRKMRNGYKVLYTFFRQEEYSDLSRSTRNSLAV